MGKEQNENFGSGVVDVFDAIASGREHKSAAPSGESTDRESRRSVAASGAKAEEQGKSDQRPKGRTGRTPGKKNGPVKEKITGRVTPDMRDAYVEWAFDDRCSLSDLIERALTEFYQRHRATSGK